MKSFKQYIIEGLFTRRGQRYYDAINITYPNPKKEPPYRDRIKREFSYKERKQRIDNRKNPKYSPPITGQFETNIQNGTYQYNGTAISFNHKGLVSTNKKKSKPTTLRVTSSYVSSPKRKGFHVVLSTHDNRSDVSDPVHEVFLNDIDATEEHMGVSDKMKMKADHVMNVVDEHLDTFVYHTRHANDVPRLIKISDFHKKNRDAQS